MADTRSLHHLNSAEVYNLKMDQAGELLWQCQARPLPHEHPHPAPGGFGFKQALLRTKHQIRGPEIGVEELWSCQKEIKRDHKFDHKKSEGFALQEPLHSCAWLIGKSLETDISHMVQASTS